MKIILLRDKGRAQALQLTRSSALLACAGVFAAAMATGYWLAEGPYQSGMDAETVSHWRDRLARQQSEVDAMRSDTRARSQAVGRQLAQMQARLLRMEALGSRVAEVADLDEGEFSFTEPPPQGGPSVWREDALRWPDLQGNLNNLASGLKARESELGLLESMLRDRDYQEAKEIAGRPVTWGWMSSGYGKRVDPFSGNMAWHAGVDFAGREGSSVIALGSGVVTYASKRFGYGLMVEINHGDGFVTRYGHHSELLVKPGDIVKRGQAVGMMGSTGRSTGPHVHLEVLKHGRHVNPARYVARRR